MHFRLQVEFDFVLSLQNSTYDMILNESFGCFNDLMKKHMSANSYIIIKGRSLSFIYLFL